ncbi:hypothetical protein ACP70R_044407 [Stipagrostis hirtigluma subsp. patula]
MKFPNKHVCSSLNDLPEELLAEIAKRLTRTSDLNSLSLVSKRFYTVEAKIRDSILVGYGLYPVTLALKSLCSRFPNLCKVEFNYFGNHDKHGMQLGNHELHVFSSCCPLLTDLTLSFCSNIDDSGLGFLACFKKLTSLRLNTLSEITSSGLLLVAVGCKNLSAIHLISCNKVGSVEWLEYLGRVGSLQELVVKNCRRISQFDLLTFGPGWMKLQKFEFEIAGYVYKTALTDGSLKALALGCLVLQSFELRFWGCEPDWPEIGFTQEGLVTLIQSCPIRHLVLSGANIFDDDGMKALSSAQSLESLELEQCIAITDAGMRLLACSPCLMNFTLRLCDGVTDDGVSEVVRVLRLESLVIEKCAQVSLQAVQGAAKSVHYRNDCPGYAEWLDEVLSNFRFLV